jgi:hypothetical protein
LPFKEPSPRLSLTREEWISALILASKWRFLHVRVRAIVVLERSLDSEPSEKIQLGRDLSISSWVIDGFVGLVEATTITDEEALKIDSGAETTAYKLFRIRELRIAGELSCSAAAESVKTKVEEIFKEELDRLRSREKIFSITK